jgi:glucokinase
VIVLTGDIGATHARLAVVEVEPGVARVVHQESSHSKNAPGLDTLVRRFLAAHTEPRPERACFGVAGPVDGGRVNLTNLGWTLDEATLRREIGIPVRLINDFVAIGYAIPVLAGSDLAELQHGAARERAPMAIIGAGSGLGHAFLLWEGDRYGVHSSEAGHGDFAPRTPLDAELLAFLRAEHGHVSWERVVSGPGLVAVYRFLAARGAPRELPGVRAELEGGDAAAVITKHALARSDPLCGEALDRFVDAYGDQAGNFALSVRARSVYIAGGIAPRILPKLLEGGFARAFRAKGRFEDFLTQIPIRVITRPDVGLVGAAVAAGF